MEGLLLTEALLLLEKLSLTEELLPLKSYADRRAIADGG